MGVRASISLGRRSGVPVGLHYSWFVIAYCVKRTTIGALQAGFDAVVLTDAIAGIDVNRGDVDRALTEMSRAGAEMATGLGVMHSR
jgi:Isochorismatase family